MMRQQVMGEQLHGMNNTAIQQKQSTIFRKVLQ